MTKTIATPPTAEAGQRPRLLDETLMTIPEAAKLFPGAKGSKAIYAATVYRWARIGVRGRRLETIRVGSLVRTSREAIERFVTALTEQAERDHNPAPLPSQAPRLSPTAQAAHDQAMEQLRARGLVV